MGHRFRILIGLALAALLAAAVIHRIGPGQKGDERSAANDAGKQRVIEFWKLHREANRLRLEGDLEAAVAVYRQSLELNAGHEDSLYYLGLALEGIGEYEEAAALYRRITQQNALSSRAFAQLGHVLSTPAPGATLDFEEAERAYRRCIDLNPEHSGPYLNLGRLKLNEGRFEKALEYFQTAAHYGSPEGNLLAGYAGLLLGRAKNSRESLERVVEWYAHERRISERGAVLEGDLFSGAKGTPSRQQVLAMQAALYRFWAAPGRTTPGPEKTLLATLRRRFAAQGSWRELGARLGLSARMGRAAWADVDHDGRVDFVAGGRDGTPRLYSNAPGGFTEITKTSGLKAVPGFWDAAWGDNDSDGLLDLYTIHSGYVARGENHLYRNNGNRTFTEVDAASGLGGKRSTFRAFFIDLNQDGHPELVEVGAAAPGTPSLRVFHREQGRWSDQAAAWGLSLQGTITDCSPADYDQDGDIDLFVYRWGRPSVLFLNEGGRFHDATQQAGLAGIRGNGFSSLFFDYDRDEFPDLLVTEHASFADTVSSLFVPSTSTSTLRLFRNLRNGRFEEVSANLKLAGSFGTIEARAADLDGDGWPDLVLANGSLDALRLEPSVVLRNVNGESFDLATLLPGIDRPLNAIGVETPDIDGDGRNEVYLAEHPILVTTGFLGGVFGRK